MSEAESEDSFVFVDKRKLGADAVAEPEASVDLASESADDSVDQLDAPQSDDDLAGLSGSSGLVAYVIGLIASDAWQRLGLIADPSTGKVVKDLKQARFSIDCVAALVGVIDQSESELPAELRRDLQRALADLRLNFVEQSRRS